MSDPALALHTSPPWVLAEEQTHNDNFHTSIYGEGYDGLLIARGNQNGRHRQDMVLMRAAPEMLRLLREARFRLTGDLAAQIDTLLDAVKPNVS